MRRRTMLIITAAVIVVIATITTVLWSNGRSYDDIVRDCQKALNAQSTKTHRPDACKDVKPDDYDTLLVAWTLKHALSKDDRDTLDYYDDGSINGSVG